MAFAESKNLQELWTLAVWMSEVRISRAAKVPTMALLAL
jgi:hypothetical protein